MLMNVLRDQAIAKPNRRDLQVKAVQKAVQACERVTSTVACRATTKPPS